MIASLRLLFRHRALLEALASREIRARYRGSALGFLWSFLNPLLLLAIFTFVFGHIFTPRLGSGATPYSVFLFTGLLPWTWFASALLEASVSIVNGGALLKKVVFPAEVLPLVAVIANAFHFVVALPILLVVLAATGHPPGPWALMALPLLAIQFLFTAGIALAVSSLSVLFRDVRDLLAQALTLWFYATPVIYELVSLPEPFRGVLRWNPMAALMGGWHDALFFGRAPSLRALAAAGLCAAVTALLGYAVFDRLREVFPEEV